MATDTMMMSGGMKIAGCMRIAASPFLTGVAILSAATARARPGAGSAGPWPTRAALLARRRAAFRCAAVSPGSRKRTVCFPRTSALRCNPAGRSEYRIFITAWTSRACQRTGASDGLCKQNVAKLSRSMTYCVAKCKSPFACGFSQNAWCEMQAHLVRIRSQQASSVPQASSPRREPGIRWQAGTSGLAGGRRCSPEPAT